jgi:hypothetical protein
MPGTVPRCEGAGIVEAPLRIAGRGQRQLSTRGRLLTKRGLAWKMVLSQPTLNRLRYSAIRQEDVLRERYVVALIGTYARLRIREPTPLGTHILGRRCAVEARPEPHLSALVSNRLRQACVRRSWLAHARGRQAAAT